MDTQPDVVVMRKGKMMIRRHGEWAPLDMVMTLPNGGRVAMDGTLTMPDGTSRLMMDGEAITMGEIGETDTDDRNNEKDDH
jgi:NurA-like 5'-3' nuclease